MGKVIRCSLTNGGVHDSAFSSMDKPMTENLPSERRKSASGVIEAHGLAREVRQDELGRLPRPWGIAAGGQSEKEHLQMHI